MIAKVITETSSRLFVMRAAIAIQASTTKNAKITTISPVQTPPSPRSPVIKKAACFCCLKLTGVSPIPTCLGLKATVKIAGADTVTGPISAP